VTRMAAPHEGTRPAGAEPARRAIIARRAGCVAHPTNTEQASGSDAVKGLRSGLSGVRRRSRTGRRQTTRRPRP
jgi:hypothetical protein